MKISVVGLGKLGAPIVAVLASKGFEVIGIDVNPAFVDKINNHVAPVEEPRLQVMLTENRARISATSDWARAIGQTDVTYIIVPTPSGADGAFRNDYVLEAMDQIGRVLSTKSGYHLVVVNSTTMPGSVGGPIKERLVRVSGRKLGANLGLCYNPEFIALGDVIQGLLHPDFVLIGESDTKAGEMLEGIYRKVVGENANIARMNFANAELTKISVNTYVTMKISFANMLGEICDRLDTADVAVVADAIGRDSRIGRKYLKPAVGYGGPCFPRDTTAFARLGKTVGVPADLAEATDAVNRRQVIRLAEIVKDCVRADGTVAVLGLSYKPNTPVIEESQGVMLSRALVEAGFKVIVHDPMAIKAAMAVLGSNASSANSARDAVANADAIVIMTPWAEYDGFSTEWIASGKVQLIVDCWRQLDPSRFSSHCKVVQLGNADSLPGSISRVVAAE